MEKRDELKQMIQEVFNALIESDLVMADIHTDTLVDHIEEMIREAIEDLRKQIKPQCLV